MRDLHHFILSLFVKSEDFVRQAGNRSEGACREVFSQA